MSRSLEVRSYNPEREQTEHGLLAEDVYQNIAEVLGSNPDFQKALAKAFFAPKDIHSEKKVREMYELIPDFEVEYPGSNGDLVIVGVKSTKQTEGYNRRWMSQELSYKTRGLEFLVTSSYYQFLNEPTKNHYGEILLRDSKGHQIASGLEALAKSAELLPELGIEVPLHPQATP